MKKYCLWSFYLLIFITLCWNCSADKGIIVSEKRDVLSVGSIIGLKPEYKERYIILHKHTFPGVLERLSKSNITNYSIFLKDEILFSHFEYIGSDFEKDMALIGDEVTKEWWKLTDPMQEPLDSRIEGEWWAKLDLLYRMDSSKVSYQNAQRVAFYGNLKNENKERLSIYLNEIDDKFRALLLNNNIQNWTVYRKNSAVYFYYEYSGNDIDRDCKELENSAAFRLFKAKIEPLFEPAADDTKQIWYGMNEVFHTD